MCTVCFKNQSKSICSTCQLKLKNIESEWNTDYSFEQNQQDESIDSQDDESINFGYSYLDYTGENLIDIDPSEQFYVREIWDEFDIGYYDDYDF